MIHPTAEVSVQAVIGEGTSVWNHAQVREGVVIGCECIIGKGVYVGFGVRIGNRCKLQNGVSVYRGTSLADGVFLGPGAVVLNDKYPRAINPDGSLKSGDDWIVSPALIEKGASIGASAVILPGVSVGRWAMVGAGSVVTQDVPHYGLVWGNPAHLRGFVCPCGLRLRAASQTGGRTTELRCPKCGITIGKTEWEQV